MAPRNPILKTFCTTREAAELLGVSLRTAQLWTESGLLEAWKTGGGHRRITRTSIERIIANPPLQGVLMDAHPARRAGDLASAAPPKPFNILVVEDDSSLRRLYELKLRGWPMKPVIFSTSDGYEALIRIGDSKPDLVIADLQMPGMDGFHMLRAIRGAPELAGLAIIVVSGLDAEEIAHRGDVPAGIEILPKPVPFDRLLAMAERVLDERQQATLEASR
ncbi:MAG: response regulator [Rhodocyclaceae bacterium]|nr:MAG: response regulator [Rhodocyclaceae bacterium]